MLNSRPISDPAPVNMDPQVWPQTLNMYFQTPKNGSLLKPAAKIKGTLSKDLEILNQGVGHSRAIGDG